MYSFKKNQITIMQEGTFHLLLIEAMWNPTNIQHRGRIFQWFKFRKFATRTTFQWLHENQATNNQKHHQQKIEI